jgi:prepilin-type N-terminal cleavage/methylation domain-containing protein
MSATATKMAPQLTHQRGFSFIEVLVAMSILVVGSVSVLALFAIGVDRMVERRVEARYQQVRPEIDAILQTRVDSTRPGELPAAIKRASPVLLSRRGYSLAAEFKTSPFKGAPGYLATVEMLFRGEPVKRELIPLRRSFLYLKEVMDDGKKPK